MLPVGAELRSVGFESSRYQPKSDPAAPSFSARTRLFWKEFHVPAENRYGLLAGRRRRDPLLIGELRHDPHSQFFLIDQFDLTKAAQYLTDEFATTSG